METDRLLRSDEKSSYRGGTTSTTTTTTTPSLSSLQSTTTTTASLVRSFPRSAESSSAEYNTKSNDCLLQDFEINNGIDTSCRVYQAAKEAGTHAFGIIAVDVWLLEHGRFVHETLWVDPIYIKRNPSDALDQIINKNHLEYATPVPQVPGAGLAGYFWSLMGTTTSEIASTRLIWRDLRAITSDPFQPPYRRMKVLEEAGFGKATGIAFDILGHRGVVIYLARESASEQVLNDSINTEYLRFASQHIGTVSALTKPRRAAVSAKEHRKEKLFRRVLTKVNSFSAFCSLHRSVSTRSLRSLQEHQQEKSLEKKKKRIMISQPYKSFENCLKAAHQQSMKVATAVSSTLAVRTQSMVEKSRGSDLKPPPPALLPNAIWTFVGAFLTLLTLSSLSIRLNHLTGTGIVLAPFGALLTLQFSLTAAPASQPRNVVYGQLISLSLALLGRHQVVVAACPAWILMPIVTALAIAVMSKFGVTHPPAAAAIIALYSQPDGFNFVAAALLVFLGNLIAVALAVFINNLSEKRQYPVYWEFGILNVTQSFLAQCIPKRADDERPLEIQEYVSINMNSPMTVSCSSSPDVRPLFV